MFNIFLHSTALDWARFDEVNVCAVDWNRLARYNYARCATVHLKLVANAIVYFIQQMTKYGLNPADVSIAGFSLGAQIAGLVGSRMPSHRIKAIYGGDFLLKGSNLYSFMCFKIT